MADLTLVVLAAGMGSRYGGMKQLEPVGPSGETIMDYSVYDGVRAGFNRVVFVIRPDMESAFRAFARGRYGAKVDVATVLQRLEDVPPDVSIPAQRTKPWGTGHAVLAAEGATPGPFAVVNADDFYGREAFDAAARFLKLPSTHPTFALIGYRLEDTVSEAGGVNRGVCRVDAEGWLLGIEEVVGIKQADGRMGRWAANGVYYPGDTLVSMNFWCLTPAVFPILGAGFEAFLRSLLPIRPSTHPPIAEFPLPVAFQAALTSGAARVKVLQPGARWWGMTYPADRPAVQTAIRKMVAGGRYRSPLFSP